MAVSAKVLSGNARFVIDGKTVFHATSCSIDNSMETKERATKDTKGSEFAIGKRSWTGSVDALATYDANGDTLDFIDLYELYLNQTDEGYVFEFVPFDSDATKKLVGRCLIGSVGGQFDADEDGTQSISLSGIGVLEKETVVGGEFESPKLEVGGDTGGGNEE